MKRSILGALVLFSCSGGQSSGEDVPDCRPDQINSPGGTIDKVTKGPNDCSIRVHGDDASGIAPKEFTCTGAFSRYWTYKDGDTNIELIAYTGLKNDQGSPIASAAASVLVTGDLSPRIMDNASDNYNLVSLAYQVPGAGQFACGIFKIGPTSTKPLDSKMTVVRAEITSAKRYCKVEAGNGYGTQFFNEVHGTMTGECLSGRAAQPGKVFIEVTF